MSTPEIITHDGKPAAMILRASLAIPPGVQFFTDEDNPFQFGFHNQKAGVVLHPHIHRMDAPITVTEIQEFLYILSGKITVSLYTHSGTVYTTVTLSAGDGILLMSGGHGVTYIEDTKMFEIKQGPYPGTSNAKIYFEKQEPTV